MICSRPALSAALSSAVISAVLLAAPSAAVADDAVTGQPPATNTDASLPDHTSFEELPVPAPEESAAVDVPDPAADAAYRHEELDPFRMVGVTWEADPTLGPVTVQVQVKTAGQWSEWVSLDAQSEVHEGGRPGTDPLWLDEPADGVAVTVTSTAGEPRDVKVMTIDPVAEDTTRPAVFRRSEATAVQSVADSSTQPPIITRAQWGAASPRKCDATTSPTRGIVLHHTAGNNNYQAKDSAAIVRGIQTFHITGQGWCDIGYNFLVDKYGQIFEGRAGSLTQQVRGAHAGNWAVNDATIGISMMGNYDVAQMTEPLRASVVRLTAWRLSRVGANPYGLYQAGGRMYNVIGAHREVMSTACPGRYGYAWLPNYRDRVAAAMADAPLIKAQGSSAVYLVMDKKRYHVPNMAELAVFSSALGQIREVSASTVNGLPQGGTASRFVRDPRDGALYLLQNNGVRSWFPTEHMVNTYGYRLHGYTTMTPQMLERFRRGSDVGPVFSSEDGSSLYVVEGLQKRHLTTEEAWSDVTGGKRTYARMSGDRARQIPEGPRRFSTRNTVRSPSAAEVYVPLTDSVLAHVPSFELAREYGATVDRVVDGSGPRGEFVTRSKLSPFVRCNSINYVVASGRLYPTSAKTSTAGWTPTETPASACAALHRAKTAVNDRMVFIKVPGEDPVYVLDNMKVRHVTTWTKVLSLNNGKAPTLLDWHGSTIHAIGWGPAVR